MVYTLWENTPLKWHKFLTFFLLPLGAILNVCQAILAISDIQNWAGILIPVNIIDLIRFIVCAILGITAIYGCLPSRRRWYGPKCAIILYAVLSVYSIYNIVAAYLLNVADSEFISRSIANLISFSLTSGLMYIYYKKRRLLFSNSNISPQQRHVKHVTEIQCSKSEPENSVELLMEIQKDNESMHSNTNTINQPIQKGRTVTLRVAIIIGIVCVFALLGCIISASRTLVLQAENEKLRDDYEYQRNFRNDAEKENRELREEVTDINNSLRSLSHRLEEVLPEYYFYHDGAVIVTEYGTKYHTYGCQYLDGKTYWIYNVELAIYEGYTPCSVCNPPRP